LWGEQGGIGNPQELSESPTQVFDLGSGKQFRCPHDLNLVNRRLLLG